MVPKDRSHHLRVAARLLVVVALAFALIGMTSAAPASATTDPYLGARTSFHFTHSKAGDVIKVNAFSLIVTTPTSHVAKHGTDFTLEVVSATNEDGQNVALVLTKTGNHFWSLTTPTGGPIPNVTVIMHFRADFEFKGIPRSIEGMLGIDWNLATMRITVVPV